MKVFTLSRELFIPTSIEKAWEFFSSPDNLGKITPSYMGFKILSPTNRENIRTGMEIVYKVKPVLNIPLTWVTVIDRVDAPYSFVDTQKKGPYKIWWHSHQFVPTEGGVLMKDTVNYVLPLGWLGIIMHSLFVKKQLKNIFDYRKKAVHRIFNSNV